jgi:5-methylcytosine-specific restriction endonuclease McrA
MAKEFAKSFYNSAAWKKTSKAYASSKVYICEKCGHQGYIVHHKIALTPQNIGNSDITLLWSNLMYLCLECHNRIHAKKEDRQMTFDAEGNLINVTDTSTPL